MKLSLLKILIPVAVIVGLAGCGGQDAPVTLDPANSNSASSIGNSASGNAASGNAASGNSASG